jgi:hypothetical protein
MISNKKAFEAAKIVAEYCKERSGCQNCIFRLNKCDHWECQMKHPEYLDEREISGNIEAKKKNRGYI